MKRVKSLDLTGCRGPRRAIYNRPNFCYKNPSQNQKSVVLGIANVIVLSDSCYVLPEIAHPLPVLHTGLSWLHVLLRNFCFTPLAGIKIQRRRVSFCALALAV